MDTVTLDFGIEISLAKKDALFCIFEIKFFDKNKEEIHSDVYTLDDLSCLVEAMKAFDYNEIQAQEVVNQMKLICKK